MKLKDIKTPKGVQYSDEPQGSPEWIANRFGKIGASELHKWMLRALVTNKETKVKERTGAYLSGHKELERQKAFEKAFKRPFNKFVTSAMQEGIDQEAYVRDEYAKLRKCEVDIAGSFYDDWSVASPDGLIGEDGGLEIKWLQDNSWSEVVTTNEPLEEHYYQIQGNLRLSGRKWWDYVAGNGNTGAFVIIRVQRDEELIKKIDEEVRTVAEVEPISTDNVYEFSQPVESETVTTTNIWE